MLSSTQRNGKQRNHLTTGGGGGGNAFVLRATVCSDLIKRLRVTWTFSVPLFHSSLAPRLRVCLEVISLFSEIFGWF